MITEKTSSTANPAPAPPSYDSVVDTKVQPKDAYPDEKHSMPDSDAPPYAGSSKQKPGMTEAECTQSGGHVIHTEYFRPGGPMAIAATVVMALWNAKPVVCERCSKDLYEADLKEVWERMAIERRCARKGKQEWPGKECDGAGFYDRRCGKGKQSQGRPGCGM